MSTKRAAGNCSGMRQAGRATAMAAAERDTCMRLCECTNDVSASRIACVQWDINDEAGHYRSIGIAYGTHYLRSIHDEYDGLCIAI